MRVRVRQEIFAAIEELPSECRRIFKMSYLEHMDLREITEKLQNPIAKWFQKSYNMVTARAKPQGCV